MRTFGKIVRNSAANYGGNIITLVVGFLLTPFLVRSLGNEGYGAWVLVGSIGSYFWLLDFGLGSSVTKFVSELHATKSRDRLNSVVASSFALLAVVGVVALGGSWVVAQMMDRFFSLPDDLVPQVQMMIYITGVTLLVSFPLGVFGGALRGYQRYDLINLVGIVSTVANAALSFVVVQRGMGLVGLSLVGLMTNIIVGGGRWLLTRWVDPELVLRPRDVRMSVLRDITNFSAWVFVINLATQVVYRTSPIIITAILGVAAVTPFALASSLVQYLRRLVEPILSVLLPAYAELSAVDDGGRVRTLFLQASRVVGALAMPMTLGLLLLGKPFIALWVGPAYEQSGELLYLLVPPTYLSFLVATGDKLLWAKGKVRVNSYVAIADTVLNLSLSIVLTIAVGLPGVALATLISVLVTNGLWLIPYICRESGVPIGGYLRGVVGPLILPAIPSAALVLLLMSRIEPHGYAQLAILAFACAASYWTIYVVCCAREEAKDWSSRIRATLSERARRDGGSSSSWARASRPFSIWSK